MMDAASFANLLSYSAQIACIVALGALLPAAIRLDAPGVRYHYWRVLTLLCLVLPWLQGRIARAGSVAASTLGVTLDTSATVEAAAPLGSMPSIDWAWAGAVVLAAGATARLGWLAIGLVRLQRLRRAGQPASSHEHDELQRAIGTHAEIRYLPDLAQPVTFGVFRPIVLLPSTLVDHPDDVRRAVVAHELFHVQRRDWAWVLVEELIRAAFWFHPAVWWLVSRVQLAREEVVDELAVLITGRRRTYVEALLAFADETPLAPAAAFARRRHLFRRMMLISREAAVSSKRVVASCAAMALVVALGSWYAVDAFPLVVSAGQSTLQKTPGPLERAAVPITPENPIPRRVRTVPAEYPAAAEAEGARGTVTLQVTLDVRGQVAEMRVASVRIRAAAGQMNFTNALTTDVEKFLESAPSGPELRLIYEAFVLAAATAVEQWRYEAPYRGPISFPAAINFAPKGVAGGVAGGVPGGVVGGVPGGVVGGVVGGVSGASPWTEDGALRVGGSIKAPTKIKDVKPVYPPLAQAARVQGVVIVEARIGPDGKVTDVRILRSIPLLDQAALDAVYEWEFTPTLLNGQAVPIVMTMTVSFKLD